MPDPGRPAVRIDPTLAGLLVTALRGGDAGHAASVAQLLHSQGVPLAALVDQVVLPVLAAEGALCGPADLPGLQALCATTSQVLARLGPPRRRPPRGSVVLACAPGERHQLGVQGVALALEEAGFVCRTVGDAPLPVLGPWCTALPEPPDVVGLSLGAPLDEADLREGLTLLREALPGVRVVLGGTALRRDPDLPSRLGADGCALSATEAVAVVTRLTLPLSELEVAALRLVAAGSTNGQTARALGVTPSRVKSLLDRVFVVLGVPDRAAASAEAVRRGWI